MNDSQNELEEILEHWLTVAKTWLAAAIQALIQRERQAARQDTIEQLHQIYSRGDVTIEQALAELEEAA